MDNMWFNENTIRILSQQDLINIFKQQNSNTLKENTLIKSLEYNTNLEKQLINKSNIKDIAKNLINEQYSTEYNIGKLLDLRDSLQKKEEIQKNSFNKLSQNFVFNHLNPLKNNKLPIVPASNMSNTSSIIEENLKELCSKEAITQTKKYILGYKGNTVII